jgi:hypothetical protein
MHFSRSFVPAGALSGVLLFALAFALPAQEAPPQQGQQKSPWVEATDTRPAEQAYKNIKVFTGLPANRLERVMKTWKDVLGVECTFCHIRGEWEKDDVEEKESARFMKKMTDEIAKTHFDGKYEVTCYTCHRGDKHPAKNPPAAPVKRQARPVAPNAGL